MAESHDQPLAKTRNHLRAAIVLTEHHVRFVVYDPDRNDGVIEVHTLSRNVLMAMEQGIGKARRAIEISDDD